MHPGASLILTQRLLVKGTVESPVRFIPAFQGQEPWGALVLLGEGAAGSSLSHCELVMGSGYKEPLSEYSAMLSIHGVPRVSVDHCLLRDSRLVDDMMHVVYSDVRVSDSRFERSLFDALDVDISRAVIERSEFIDSGNDAVDLMTSQALVRESLIQGSGDKGVSVGEGSRLLALNDRIVSNQIGVQSKDGSVATLYNVTLSGNAKPLDAYKKNWRYDDGGRVFLYKGRVEGNLEPITSDKRSSIWVYDSYVNPLPLADEGKKPRIRLAASVDARGKKKARIKKFWRLPEEETLLEGTWGDVWKEVKPQERGGHPGAN
jgi:hypothetical protein